MSNMWNSVVDLKDTLPGEVQFGARAIVVGALLAYWFWFRPKAVKLQRALAKLDKALANPEAGWESASGDAAAAAKESHGSMAQHHLFAEGMRR